MKEREEQFRKIQASYDSFTFMFYEAMRRNSHYTFKDLDKQIDKTIEELQKLKDSNVIAYDFNMLGNIYAYSKDDLFSKQNTVFELHYSTIFDFKKI